MRPRRAVGAGFDEVATDVHRVSVLLTAGLDPMAALRAFDHPTPPLRAAAACASALEVPEALLEAASTSGSAAGERRSAAAADDEQARAWRVVAASWAVAVESGAPLAGTLARAAAGLRQLADLDRQVEVATAGPLASARVVGFLPLAGLALGALLGADPVGVAFGTLPGAFAVILGSVLLVVGARWNRRLIAEARARGADAGAASELLALALAGGGAPERALELVTRAAASAGLAVAEDDAHATLAFARRSGVPAAALLRAHAEHARQQALADARHRAALLGTRLLAPLALCFLPAFVLLGVVPLMIGILRGVLASF